MNKNKLVQLNYNYTLSKKRSTISFNQGYNTFLQVQVSLKKNSFG